MSIEGDIPDTAVEALKAGEAIPAGASVRMDRGGLVRRLADECAAFEAAIDWTPPFRATPRSWYMGELTCREDTTEGGW